jgi:hypothetical protein
MFAVMALTVVAAVLAGVPFAPILATSYAVGRFQIASRVTALTRFTGRAGPLP